MTDEPYKLSYSGERWYVSGPGVHLPFDCQIEAMQTQSACNEAYRHGRMTDEQIRRVKELRDACVRLLCGHECMRGRLICMDMLSPRQIEIIDSQHDQATEAIKKVEGLIV